MGICAAKDTRTSQIDAALRDLDEREHRDPPIKVLFLGAGESGKSTLLKQMRRAFGKELSAEECMARRDIIRGNLLQAMRTLLEACVEAGVEVACDDERAMFEATYMEDPDAPILDCSISAEMASSIHTLWKDAGVQSVFDRRSSLQLSDSASYFLDRVRLIAAPDYCPSPDDVVRSRVRTTGLHEELIRVGDTTFRFCDVGGQRSERRKWVDFFDDVTAIIFVAATSEYDQVLFEARSQNRVHEAEDLFFEIAGPAVKAFQAKPIVLFFNKTDLFEEKVRRVDIASVPHPRAGEPDDDDPRLTFPDFAFPLYAGGADVEAAKRFFESRFLEHPHVAHRRGNVTHRWTIATNKDNVKTVFDECKRTIVQANLEGSGYIDDEEFDV